MYWRKLFDCGYFGFLITTSIPHCDEKSDKSVQLDDMCHVSQISSSLKPCCAIEIFKSFFLHYLLNQPLIFLFKILLTSCVCKAYMTNLDLRLQ